MEIAKEAALETTDEAPPDTAEEATLEIAEEAAPEIAEDAAPETTLQAILVAKRNSPPRVRVPPIDQMMLVLVDKIWEYKKTDASLRSLPDMVQAVAAHYGLDRAHVEPRTPVQKKRWEDIIMLHKTRAELNDPGGGAGTGDAHRHR